MVKKMGKIVIFSIIIVIIGINIIFKRNSNIKDNIYVVSESEEINKENVNSGNDNIEIQNYKKDNKGEMITIYISGEVKKPGVVNIECDKRLSDAIDKLGGLTEDADYNKINLASKIEDEKHYIVPKIGEDIESETGNETINETENNIDDGKININKASIEELDKLPGIGEATANKILNYREENGEFKSTEEIKNVNGIGNKKYENIKDIISIN